MENERNRDKKEDTKLLVSLQKLRLAKKENQDLKNELSNINNKVDGLIDSVNDVIDGNIFLKRKYKTNKINNVHGFKFIFSNFIEKLSKNISKDKCSEEDLNKLFSDYFIKQRNNNNEVRFFNKNQFYNLMRLNNKNVFNQVMNYIDFETSSDRRVALSIFRSYQCNHLKLFVDEIRADEEVIEAAIDSSVENYSYINCNEENYKKIFLHFFAKDKRIIQYADNRIVSDKDMFYYSKDDYDKNKINLCSYPEVIIFLDSEIVNLYVTNILMDNGNLLKYLPLNIRNNKKNILISLKTCPKNIELLNLDLDQENDYISYKEIYKLYPETLIYLDSKFQKIIKEEINKESKMLDNKNIKVDIENKNNLRSKINNFFKGGNVG